MIPPLPRPLPPPRIAQGVPPALRRAAAALYWRHFGRQILPVPVPARQGIALVAAAMRPGQALVALSAQGGLVGLVQYLSRKGGIGRFKIIDICTGTQPKDREHRE